MIVKEVCNAIWSVMKSEFLPTPSKENWETIALDFEINANFPHCIGAVDGKHIRKFAHLAVGPCIITTSNIIHWYLWQ